MLTGNGNTYRDGVGLERCRLCHHAIRSLTDEPLASIPIPTLETFAHKLALMAQLLGEIASGLERVLGQTTAQLEAAIAEHEREIAALKSEAAEAIAPHVKTDRGGLVQ